MSAAIPLVLWILLRILCRRQFLILSTSGTVGATQRSSVSRVGRKGEYQPRNFGGEKYSKSAGTDPGDGQSSGALQ
jgi:hypothetical protein